MKKFILVFVAVLMSSGCLNHKEPAEKNAREYAKTMLPDAEGVVCTNLDTDRDSYVSCTVKTKTGLVGLDCVGAQWPWVFPKNSGCKLPKLRGTVNGLE